MAYIGTLEQLGLANVLQRLEAYAKTGLLIIKHEAQWVELYFRNGKMFCFGPVRTNANLAERLLAANVISAEALQKTLHVIGDPQPGETSVAMTLMELGYTSRDQLRAWATKEALALLRALQLWQDGAMYFEDNVQTPADRLLVSLSAISLLTALPPVTPAPQHKSVQPVSPEAVTPVPAIPEPQPAMPASAAPAVPVAQTSAPAFNLPEPGTNAPGSVPSFADLTPAVSSISHETSLSAMNFSGSESAVSPTLSPPARVTTPFTPMRIDTSFMRPEMIVIPVDFAPLREKNPQIQITPEQWRILTRVDGQTTLQMICQALAMPTDLLCQVVGELIAVGFVQIVPSAQHPVKELSPVSRDVLTAGFSNGYLAPGYAAAPAQPWGGIVSTTPSISPSSSSQPFQTVSQWGNGGNGATFVPGRGWITNSQPLPPLPASDSSYPGNGNSAAYAQIGMGR